MRKTDRKRNLILLTLLFIGSFVFHAFIHGIHSPGAGEYANARSGICILPECPELGDSDAFCPICSGWLTADCPDCSGGLPVLHRTAVLCLAVSENTDTADWLLPSPRGPPQA